MFLRGRGIPRLIGIALLALAAERADADLIFQGQTNQPSYVQGIGTDGTSFFVAHYEDGWSEYDQDFNTAASRRSTANFLINKMAGKNRRAKRFVPLTRKNHKLDQ